VTGTAQGYRRADYSNPAVEMQFCPNCGTTTHWALTENFEGDRVGVNMRIFDPKDIAGIECRVLDGRNWFGKSDPAHRRAHGIVGTDIFL